MTATARIRPREVARLTGLSLRQVQHMAARGGIPGAAKLGSVWTFVIVKLRRWITEREAQACPLIFTAAAAPGTPACRFPGPISDEAYERAIGLRR